MEENLEQLEKESELRKVFSDMLSTLSLTLNDSIKWKREHDKVSNYLEIRNKELLDEYNKIATVRKDIKEALGLIDRFKFNNKRLIRKFTNIDNFLDDLIELLDKHKPYVTIEEKEKLEKESKKNCTSY